MTEEPGTSELFQAVEAICFDLDNTLYDRNGAARTVYENWLRGSNLSLEEVLHRDDGGHSSRARFFAWLEDQLGRNDLWKAYQHELVAKLVPFPRARELFKLMDSWQMPRALLTNGGPFQRRKLEALGLEHCFPSEQILVSSELGISKPNSRAFLAAAGSLDLPPSSILHVGDHPEIDIAGAAQAGFRTAWIRHENRKPACQASVTVNSLAEFVELILRLRGHAS